jgi:two-component system sensor histidine kinase/response regulator
VTSAGRAVRRCILIVEDSRTQAEALRAFLEESGFATSVASSGEKALEALRVHAVDLVISDIIMPGMSGLELCQALRADRELGDIPFMLLTSLIDPLDVIRGLESGADNYVTKPYDQAQLLRRIGRTFERRSLPRSDTMPNPIEITFLGSRFAIASEREQILDVLISSFEDIARANVALRAAEEERARLFDQEHLARRDAEEARARAEEANRGKSEFLAMMSHDLRTPLNAIAGYSELLAMGIRGPVTAPQLADLERIQRNQRHLLNLVNDILSYAKIETGTIPLEMAPVKLEATVRPLRAVIEPQAAKRGITYEYLGGDANAVVMADPERLEQVMINLLGNAVKFTADGGRVTMRCFVRDGMGLIEVTDTGIGIPESKIKLIFDPFVQVDANRGKRDGVGLGLAISRKLAQAMGGEIEVRSEEGVGSTFTVSLKLVGPSA